MVKPCRLNNLDHVMASASRPKVASLIILLAFSSYGQGHAHAQDPPGQTRTCPRPLIVDGHSHEGFGIGENGEVIANTLDYPVDRGVHAMAYALPVQREGLTDLVAIIGNELQKLDALSKTTGAFTLAHTPGEVRAACEAGMVAVLPTLEELPGVFYGDAERVDRYADLGILSITLVNNETDPILNRISPYMATLTDLGLEVLSRMNRRKVIVDISHLWPQEMIAVVEASEAPVIASHSNPNLPGGPESPLFDLVIRPMAEKGGLVQLSFWGDYLFRKDEDQTEAVERFLDQVDRVRDLVGVDHIGIGTDFQELGRYVPGDLKTVSAIRDIRKGLSNRGYTQEEIEKIMGGNFLRLLSTIQS